MSTNYLKLISNNTKRKERYSDNWLIQINPLAIAEYIQRKEEYRISWRAARAIANAKISCVYRDLVLEEENINLSEEIINADFEEIDES